MKRFLLIVQRFLLIADGGRGCSGFVVFGALSERDAHSLFENRRRLASGEVALAVEAFR